MIEAPTGRGECHYFPFWREGALTLHTASEEAGGGFGQSRGRTAGRAQASLYGVFTGCNGGQRKQLRVASLNNPSGLGLWRPWLVAWYLALGWLRAGEGLVCESQSEGDWPA